MASQSEIIINFNGESCIMNNRTLTITAAAALASGMLAMSSCVNQNKMEAFQKGSFGYDLEFLSAKDSLVVLKSGDGAAQVIVSPKYQGKVFTSTLDGPNGHSWGWVNYKALDAEVPDAHINCYGGENRFWLGPEGGQYSIFFEKGKKQVIENWFTPKEVDTEEWRVERSDSGSVSLSKRMDVTNYKGTALSVELQREVRLLCEDETRRALGQAWSDGLQCVGYETVNKITNLNDFAWTPLTGTVCVWMLDMFPVSEEAYSLIPFIPGDEESLGKEITSDYFGEIPSERLLRKDSLYVFKTDGKFRSKLGLNSKRAKGVIGNYDHAAKRLTITTFDILKDSVYLNQEWNPEKDPLQGDVLNAYNDGPLEDGSQMGPFLEMESSSPAAFLKPGEHLSHVHTVLHFKGDEDALSRVFKRFSGLSGFELDSLNTKKGQ